MKANRKFLNDTKGDIGEITSVVVGLLVIVIMGMIMAFVGTELEDAMTITTGSVWDNVTNETGDAADSGMNIVSVGVILTVLLAAVGIFVYPYIAKLT